MDKAGLEVFLLHRDGPPQLAHHFFDNRKSRLARLLLLGELLLLCEVFLLTKLLRLKKVHCLFARLLDLNHSATCNTAVESCRGVADPALSLFPNDSLGQVVIGKWQVLTSK